MSVSLEKDSTNNLILSGVINFQNVADIEKNGQKLMRSQNEIAINMAKTTAEDSAVLALLLSWKRFAQKNNKKINFLHVNHQIKAMAEVGGIELLLWKN